MLNKTLQFFLQDERSRLVQLSFLMLFIELVLIRWTSANVYYLFALANLVLIACFLGIGIGFLRAPSGKNHFKFAPLYLAMIIFLCYYFSTEYIPAINKQTGNLDYSGSYFQMGIYPLWLSIPLIFISITLLMAAIADGVANSFKQFPPLQAYRFEILGSLLGIITFSLLSFIHATPIYWGIVIVFVFSTLMMTQGLLKPLQIAALIIIAGVFAKESWQPNHFWSSYYKIIVQQYAKDSHAINVNGIIQQVVEPVAMRRQIKPFYFLPYQHISSKSKLNHVLIIGSGTGGDVAIALAQGAKHVDAVEIDPVLYRLGKTLNPDQPYSDSRVTVFINDGRAFLQQTNNKYDLIIFALTDSLMLIPGQSSLRLENFLYTLEGIKTASAHLQPQGTFAIYNYYSDPWLINRLANTLSLIFHDAPCIDTFSPQDYWAMALTASLDKSTLQCPKRWVDTTPLLSTPTSDDHPFLYLKEKNLPPFYILTLIFISLTACAFIKKNLSTPGAAFLRYSDLFFMGIAFLLLETKSVINYALLFGTTWFVNALVFIGILFTVYLAVEVVARYPKIKLVGIYGLLILFLFLAWLIPPYILLNIDVLSRFCCATLLTFSPIFFANIIFANRFQRVTDATQALGINLMGAVFGGVIEYSSMLIGYRNLIIIIALLYGIAILIMQFKLRLTNDALILEKS